MKTFDTLYDAISAFMLEGYTNDFNVYRFESMNDADDSSILFVTRTSQDVKCILIDAYVPYSDSLSPLMVGKLKIDNNSYL